MSNIFINKNDYGNEKNNVVYSVNNFHSLPPISNSSLKIAILYIGIGKYKKFWADFYNTCEKYFLTNHTKHYFLFTDNIEDLKNKNVTEIYQRDLGWPGNTLYRFQMFLKIKEELEKYDYIYFFNGNTLFLETINEEDFIPTKEENYLVALSWDRYKNININEYPYDRNPKSTAYIPFNHGHYYYQGGLNGGRSKEYIDLIIECNKQIHLDDKNKIIAKNHDESHINKYLLDKTIKIINNKYGNPEEWDLNKNSKIIFRNKNSALGEDTINKIKSRNFIWRLKNKLTNTINRLFKNSEIIYLQGGLGNQMFQYAFYYQLSKNKTNISFDTTILDIENNHNGYELYKIFNIRENKNPRSFYILRVLRYIKKHKNIITILISKILEIFGFKLVTDLNYNEVANYTKHLFYLGYWQSEDYFKNVIQDIKNIYQFNTEKISNCTREALNEIINHQSISVHIRRGDYLNEKYKDIYGNICTLEYYQKAIETIKEKIKDPHFYIFSNDIEWVKLNLDINAPVTYINFNQKEDSWQDLFLMSNCKHNIIANSTFSWWGAWLNKNEKKIVISPSKFMNGENNIAQNIIPNYWIKL